MITAGCGRQGDSAPAGAGNGFPRQCEHWLGMTPLRGVRADRVVRPYKEYTVSWGGAQPDFLGGFFGGYRL